LPKCWIKKQTPTHTLVSVGVISRQAVMANSIAYFALTLSYSLFHRKSIPTACILLSKLPCRETACFVLQSHPARGGTLPVFLPPSPSPWRGRHIPHASVSRAEVSSGIGRWHRHRA